MKCPKCGKETASFTNNFEIRDDIASVFTHYCCSDCEITFTTEVYGKVDYWCPEEVIKIRHWNEEP